MNQCKNHENSKINMKVAKHQSVTRCWKNYKFCPRL